MFSSVRSAKSLSEVRKLIAGPAVNICDECVEVCVDIIVDDTRAKDVPPDSLEGQRSLSMTAKLVKDHVGVCSLCGTQAPSGYLLPIDGRGLLCGECANAVEDALARGLPNTP